MTRRGGVRHTGLEVALREDAAGEQVRLAAERAEDVKRGLRAWAMRGPWRCYAKPALLGGRTCGHENAQGVRDLKGLVCCESCGATRIASDARRPEGAS